MVREYNDTDFNMINEWFKYQTDGALEQHSLSKVGFVVDGVACGFLYQTDSNFGILETFIANPNISAKERDLALKQILESLIDASKELKLKRLFGFSTSNTMINRALDLGFKIQDVSTTVVKEL